jgi:hypothetical protein
MALALASPVQLNLLQMMVIHIAFPLLVHQTMVPLAQRQLQKA